MCTGLGARGHSGAHPSSGGRSAAAARRSGGPNRRAVATPLLHEAESGARHTLRHDTPTKTDAHTQNRTRTLNQTMFLSKSGVRGQGICNGVTKAVTKVAAVTCLIEPVEPNSSRCDYSPKTEGGGEVSAVSSIAIDSSFEPRFVSSLGRRFRQR